jgi:hypothetical protein
MDQIVAWVGIGLTSVISTATAVVYLSRQIDDKLSIDRYEQKHSDLAERLRQLELWASKKSFKSDD